MISLDNITVAYGGFTLLDGVSFHISERDRIGLVGKNGTGKSTIMKIICGEQAPTSGQVDKPSHYTIGYLPQIMEHGKGRSVIREAMTAFDAEAALEKEMEEIGLVLSSRTDYESEEYLGLISRLNDISDRLALEGNEPPEVRARKTLAGLGFKEEEMDRPTETLSQGWNMRIELAKILLQSPDLLLLDEPTNHLDIESIQWLEQYLAAYPGAVMLVSHDRRFLDNVTNRTIEILLGHVHDYKVSYSSYVALRAERMATRIAAYENQQKMIDKTEDFIARFRYKPTKSNQVQSRIKALEKLDRIELDETDNATLTVKFPPSPRSGDVPFKAVGLTAGYPGKVVFRGADIEIKRGEKVAFIGRNGEGKTTLMRIIMGELEPLDGTAILGHNVNIGYYAQNQEDILDKSQTVLGTLDSVAVGDVRTRLRDILAQFLFRGEDIDKKVAVLSGGERARLAMARLMLQPYNLLALDEPTNHMDIKSKDILKQALAAYDGTLIVVSHDRDFLSSLVDKLYEFRDGRVREYLGGVDDFLQRRSLEDLHDIERKDRAPAPQPSETASKTDYKARKAVSRDEKKLRGRVDFLEKEISSREGRMKEIEATMAAPGADDDILELTREYLLLKRDVDEMTQEWGNLLEKIQY